MLLVPYHTISCKMMSLTVEWCHWLQNDIIVCRPCLDPAHGPWHIDHLPIMDLFPCWLNYTCTNSRDVYKTPRIDGQSPDYSLVTSTCLSLTSVACLPFPLSLAYLPLLLSLCSCRRPTDPQLPPKRTSTPSPSQVPLANTTVSSYLQCTLDTEPMMHMML